jgi:hypothetical protein
MPENRRRLLARCSVAALLLAALAACAPDALRRTPEFDEWIAGVRNACHRERIGKYTVGGLLDSAGSTEGGHFLNQTSRLYFDRIDADEWARNVTAFILGRPDDPGLRCVLERLPPR